MLLVISLITNIAAQLIVRSSSASLEAALSDRAQFSLAPTRQLRRRNIVEPAHRGARCSAAALAAVAVLALVVAPVVERGHSRSRWTSSRRRRRRLFRRDRRRDRERDRRHDRDRRARDRCSRSRSGSWSPSTRASSRRQACRRVLGFVLDMLNGLPSIVIGIFIFGLLVDRSPAERGRARSRSRSSCCRSSRVPRRRCSHSCRSRCARRASRSASAAGGRRLGLTIPASFGGIITGGTLAIARAAGETAPLLFTCALTTTQTSWDPRQPLQSIPLTIFQVSREPRSGAPRSGVGGGARAHDLRARDQHRLEGRAGAQQEEAHTMKRGYDRHGGSDRGRPARKHADHSSRDGLRHPRPLGVLRQRTRGQRRQPRDLPQHGHRPDRPLGLRQEHVHPLPEPHERPDPGARIDGQILYHGQNMYGSGVDPASVRRWIGMVFQKPNPFPKSIYDNVAWGPRVLGMRKGLDERVERALTQAALWDEVKGRLEAQRARALRVASSSASASRARSRSSPRSSCSTSRRPRSTRSRRRRSRT